MHVSDAVVIGAGPAGLTAALFLARHGRDVVVIDELLGNHLLNAATVENFPGFPSGVQGPELWTLLQQQALEAGATFVPATAEGIETIDDGRRVFRVDTGAGTQDALTVILCMGSSLRRLNVDGEARFEGRGVSHCATCDGPLFHGRHVAVIGGGDSALDEALVLGESASQVTVVHRGDALSGQSVLRQRVAAHPSIAVRARTQVVRLEGDGLLEGVVLRDDVSGEESHMSVAGVFTFIGLEPNTRFVGDLVELDQAGHVVTDTWMQTSAAGLFAAGDVRRHSAAQFVSAAGDGATAALAAHRFLESGKRSPSDLAAAP
jgi:thioredoxin reductase (NADPH)